MIILEFLGLLFGAAVIINIVGLVVWLIYRAIRDTFGFYRETVGTLKPGVGKVFLTISFVLAFLVALFLVRW